MLSLVKELITADGYSIVNIGTSLFLENSKIKPYFTAMQDEISGIINNGLRDVSTNVTTTEKMGFVGH